jgi:FimV-like protein
MAKIFIELEDYASARPLLNEVFKGDNLEYKKAAKQLLDEILAEKDGKQRLTAPSGRDPDTTAKYRAFNDLSQRFQMLSDDEVSQRLVLAQIYMELGDTLKARGNVAEVIAENSHDDEANRYLKKAISNEIGDLSLISTILEQDHAAKVADPNVAGNEAESDLPPQDQAIKDFSDRFTAIVGNDNAEKYALAQIHVGMGQYDLARSLIREVIDSGDSAYLLKARKLLDRVLEGMEQ